MWTKFNITLQKGKKTKIQMKKMSKGMNRLGKMQNVRKD